MSITELFTAIAAALSTAFTGSPFAIWPTTPKSTSVPAVWPAFASSFTTADPVNGGSVAFELVAALAPQESPAQNAALADAHDRFDTITASAVGAAIAGRSAVLEVRQIGGVDHTALVYSLTVARGLPC